MRIYAAGNEMDMLSFFGAEPSRKLGTYNPALERASIRLAAGSGATLVLENLEIIEKDYAAHFVIVSELVDNTDGETAFFAGENTEAGKICFKMSWLRDGAMKLQLNTVDGEGPEIESVQPLHSVTRRTVDVLVTQDEENTVMKVYVGGLLCNTLTVPGEILYPDKFTFLAPAKATAYITQVIISDFLARDVQSVSLIPLSDGHYTDWEGDYKNVSSLDLDDSDVISTGDENVVDSYKINSADGDELFNFVHVLHDMEDSLDKSYSKNNLVSHNAASINAAQKKFGTNSLNLVVPPPAEGDPVPPPRYATIAWTDSIELADWDFCIEFWWYVPAINNTQFLIGQGELTTGSFWRIVRTDTNFVKFYCSDVVASESIPVDLVSTTALNQSGEWHAIRVTRDGYKWFLYIDGKFEAQAIWSGKLKTVGKDIFIGYSPSFTNPSPGYFDQLRITIDSSRDVPETKVGVDYTLQTDPWPLQPKLPDVVPETWGDVLGISVNARCRRAEFGDVSMMIRRNGTDMASDPVQAGSSFSGRSAFFPVDEMTGEAWDYADLVNLEVGIASGDVGEALDPFIEPPIDPPYSDLVFDILLRDNGETVVLAECIDVGTFDGTIDYGDGSDPAPFTTFDDAAFTHTYAQSGRYQVRISGSLPSLRVSSQMAEFLNWGETGLLSLNGCFTLVDGAFIYSAVDGQSLGSVLDMSYMFQNAQCNEMDLRAWDVSSVQNMSHMFDGCEISFVNMQGWNCESVTDMSYMLSGGDTQVNTSGWATTRLRTVASMFENNTVANPNVSGWDVSEVEDFSHMFHHAHSAEPNTVYWVVQSATNLDYMFSNALAADPITDEWDVSGVTSMNWVFEEALAANPNVSSWDVGNVQSFTGMFYRALLANPDVVLWDVSAATNMDSMFDKSGIVNRDMSDWPVIRIPSEPVNFIEDKYPQALRPVWGSSPLTITLVVKTTAPNTTVSMASDFNTAMAYDAEIDWGDGYVGYVTAYNDLELDHEYATAGEYTIVVTGTFPAFQAPAETIKFLNWGATGLLTVEDAFIKPTLFEYLATDGQGLGTLTSMMYMFREAKISNSIDLRNLNFSNVTTFAGMFGEARIPSVNLNWVDVSNVANFRYMFSAFKGNVDANGWRFHSATQAQYMFNYTDGLITINNWELSNLPSADYMFHFTKSTNLQATNWLIPNVTSMQNLFYGATIGTANLATWSFDSIENMSRAFQKATIGTLITTEWDLSTVKYIGAMFEEAVIQTHDISDWIMSSLIGMTYAFFRSDLGAVDLTKWDVSDSPNFDSVFRDTDTTPDISNWNTVSGTTFISMFEDYRGADTDVSSFDMSSATDLTAMFKNAENMNPEVDFYDTTKVTVMYEMFYGANNLSGRDMSGWCVTNIPVRPTRFTPTGYPVALEPVWGTCP